MRQIYGVYDGIFEKAEGNWAFPRHLCHVQGTREAAMNPRTRTLGQTRHFHGTACPPCEGSVRFSASPAPQYLGNHLSPAVINKDIWLPPVGPLLWHKGWAPAPWGQWKPKNRAKFSLDLANPKLTCRENSLQNPWKLFFITSTLQRLFLPNKCKLRNYWFHWSGGITCTGVRAVFLGWAKIYVIYKIYICIIDIKMHNFMFCCDGERVNKPQNHLAQISQHCIYI